MKPYEKPYEIKKGIYWVGAIDWSVKSFHGHTYNTKNGTTYNAYLIIDEKIALVDAVYPPFTRELIENIRAVVPLERIDYVIANHVETDHSGALPEVLKACPKAKVFCTAKGKEGLYRHYYENWDFQTVRTGDKVKLGRRTLQFIEAAMIHWPDSMFTYCPEEELLMPNDAFGQHYATSERFDDSADEAELESESAKYFANILWPFSSIILKKIEEIKKSGIPIRMIAPSHGIIWRKDVQRPINDYIGWCKNETKPKAVIVYETMYGATEEMARHAARGMNDAGVKVEVFDVNQSNRTEVIKEMLDAKGYMFGSSTHDNDMLPNLAGFLEFFKGLKPKNRIGAAFGSYGWSGGATDEIEGILKKTGVETAQPALTFKYRPNEAELQRCYEYGTSFAELVKK